jgi:uracil-DNA glycosylase family 4
MPNRGDGPIPARVMLCGEAWGEYEERYGRPFVGPAGSELDRMLHEVGIMRSECFVTNLVNKRPPNNEIGAWIALKKKDITKQHVLLRDKYVLPVIAEGYKQLLAEIQLVQPNLIIAFGNCAMWALTGKWGIRNWRGSQLAADNGVGWLHNPAGGMLAPKVIPTIHPAAVLREWSQRAAVVNDLRRARRHLESRVYSPPAWSFIIKPSYAQVTETLLALHNQLEQKELWIDLDLETSNGHIACCGLSWSKLDAICIPFMTRASREGYWQVEEEAAIVHMLYRVLTHRNVRVRWQNGLYDVQYIHRHWHFIPRGAQDTMISQHAIFSDQPKALHYQASLYAEWYVYWKDEGKQLAKGGSEEEHWNYNCQDCVYTREVGEVELATAKRLGLGKVHQFQQAMFWPVFRAMQRGVRVITQNRNDLAMEVQEQISLRQELLQAIIGHPINAGSPVQMKSLFYDDLKQPPIMTRAKKNAPSHVTCDDEALQKIAKREPLLKPIINCISDIRTLEIFLGNFILAKLDADGRMRCSYNIGGSESGKSAPKTYRLSSSKNAFGSGTNLQNIPSEKSKSVGKAAARGHMAMLGDPYSLPNVRSLFGPDPGCTFFDMDLDRADLQVMAWDADEPLLKEALKKKVDLHLLNVYVLDSKDPPPLEELVETHPRYPDHRGPRKLKREFAKVFCHATDYLGKARTVAAATGRTVYETERAQKIYLETYSGIKRWQDRVIEEVKKKRYVENRFGYRWYIFDRIDDQVMPEAVAWIPQSTVSIVINRIWMNLFQDAPEAEWNFDMEHVYKLLARRDWIEVLLQVHDSLAGSFPTTKKAACLQRLEELSRVVIPYDDPLIIPTGISTSEISWGDCK